MDLAAVRQVLGDIALQSAFQAFLVTASAEGFTVREIAAQIGVPPSTLHRWLVKARARRPANPRAELVSRPAGAGPIPCVHGRAFFLGRRRICLECLATNFQRELDAQRGPTDPRPDPVVVPSAGKPSTRKQKRALKQASATTAPRRQT